MADDFSTPPKKSANVDVDDSVLRKKRTPLGDVIGMPQLKWALSGEIIHVDPPSKTYLLRERLGVALGCSSPGDVVMLQKGIVVTDDHDVGVEEAVLVCVNSEVRTPTLCA